MHTIKRDELVIKIRKRSICLYYDSSGYQIMAGTLKWYIFWQNNVFMLNDCFCSRGRRYTLLKFQVFNYKVMI